MASLSWRICTILVLITTKRFKAGTGILRRPGLRSKTSTPTGFTACGGTIFWLLLAYRVPVPDNCGKLSSRRKVFPADITPFAEPVVFPVCGDEKSLDLWSCQAQLRQ